MATDSKELAQALIDGLTGQGAEKGYHRTFAESLRTGDQKLSAQPIRDILGLGDRDKPISAKDFEAKIQALQKDPKARETLVAQITVALNTYDNKTVGEFGRELGQAQRAENNAINAMHARQAAAPKTAAQNAPAPPAAPAPNENGTFAFKPDGSPRVFTRPEMDFKPTSSAQPQADAAAKAAADKAAQERKAEIQAVADNLASVVAKESHPGAFNKLFGTDKFLDTLSTLANSKNGMRAHGVNTYVVDDFEKTLTKLRDANRMSSVGGIRNAEDRLIELLTQHPDMAKVVEDYLKVQKVVKLNAGPAAPAIAATAKAANPDANNVNGEPRSNKVDLGKGVGSNAGMTPAPGQPGAPAVVEVFKGDKVTLENLQTPTLVVPVPN